MGKKLEDMKNKKLHCCNRMDFEILGNAKVLFYSAKVREYNFVIPNSSVVIANNYCVFCGVKLPDSLRYEWFWFLQSEYGLNNPLNCDLNTIPAEFLTDEWWKKRDLANIVIRQSVRNAMIQADPDEWAEKMQRNQVWEAQKANYNGPHCCLTMDAELADSIILHYVPHLREYQVQSVGVLMLNYCPFCGIRESQSLRKTWLEILKADYGLVDPFKKDKRKVPQEFLTDEWWKKRGL
jgi:hypothetical protein